MERFGGFMGLGAWGDPPDRGILPGVLPGLGAALCHSTCQCHLTEGNWKALMSLEMSVFCKKCGKKLSLKFNPAWNAQGVEERSKTGFVSGELRLHMKEPCKYLPC